jgi:hypothetical protein
MAESVRFAGAKFAGALDIYQNGLKFAILALTN